MKFKTMAPALVSLIFSLFFLSEFIFAQSSLTASQKRNLWNSNFLILKDFEHFDDLFPLLLRKTFAGNRGNDLYATAFKNSTLGERLQFLLLGEVPSHIKTPPHLLPYLDLLKTQFNDVRQFGELIDRKPDLFLTLARLNPWKAAEILILNSEQESLALIFNKPGKVDILLKVLALREVREVIGWNGLRSILDPFPGEDWNRFLKNFPELSDLTPLLESCRQVRMAAAKGNLSPKRPSSR